MFTGEIVGLTNFRIFLKKSRIFFVKLFPVNPVNDCSRLLHIAFSRNLTLIDCMNIAGYIAVFP